MIAPNQKVIALDSIFSKDLENFRALKICTLEVQSGKGIYT